VREMGNRYTVNVWGKHFGESVHSFLQVWGGESLLRALWETFKARRQGFACVKLEIR